MKTTVVLPDDLFRALKVRAARDNRTLKDLIADLLRSGLAAPDAPPVLESRHTVRFPLPHCEDLRAGEGMSPERMAEILLEQEETNALALMRQ